MYLLDTDICSYIIKQRPVSVLEKLDSIRTSNLCISVVVQAELLFGVVRTDTKSLKKSRQEIVENFVARITVLPWDSAAAKEYAWLRAHLEHKGKPIGNMDLMIAAHALSVGATLVTNNQKHFSIVPKLKIDNWV